MKICFVSIDVESDFGKNKSFQGTEKLDKLLDIFKKNNIPATLFITGNIFEEYFKKIKAWSEIYEIAFHGYSHRFWNLLSSQERKKEIDDFISLYQKTLSKKPKGFRAPSHVIDNQTIDSLEKKGFYYDSSVVPHYPFLKSYRGYRGRAFKQPYFPSKENYRKKGQMKILEIPVSGILSIPLAGTWISKLPFFIYKVLFTIKSPEFLSLSLHSWDSLNNKLIIKLEKLLELLKNKGYVFLNGKQVYEQFSKN